MHKCRRGLPSGPSPSPWKSSTHSCPVPILVCPPDHCPESAFTVRGVHINPSSRSGPSSSLLNMTSSGMGASAARGAPGHGILVVEMSICQRAVCVSKGQNGMAKEGSNSWNGGSVWGQGSVPTVPIWLVAGGLATGARVHVAQTNRMNDVPWSR